MLPLLNFILQIASLLVFIVFAILCLPISLAFRLYRSIGTFMIKRLNPKAEMVSTMDSLFLQHTKENPGVINSFLLLKQLVHIDRLREIINQRVLSASCEGVSIGYRFKCSIQYYLRRPVWTEVKDFDLADHVYQYGPQGKLYEKSEAMKIVADCYSQEFNKEKPMWNFIVIPFTSGECILVFRIHHVYGDGVALSKFLMKFMIDPTEKNLEVQAKRFGNKVSIWSQLGKTCIEGPLLLFRQLFLTYDSNPFHGPELSGKKIVAWTKGLDLKRIKAIRQAACCTLNDILIAALSGAIGRYFADNKLDPGNGVKVYVPIDLRRGDDLKNYTLKNHISLVILDLPVHLNNLNDLIKETSKRMLAIKNSCAPLMNYLTVTYILSRLPKWMSRLLLDDLSRKSTMVVSNVPGPTAAIYLDGKEIVQCNFFAPARQNEGLTVSLISYNDAVYMGVMSDEVSLKEPQNLTKLFEEIIDQMEVEIISKNK